MNFKIFVFLIFLVSVSICNSSIAQVENNNQDSQVCLEGTVQKLGFEIYSIQNLVTSENKGTFGNIIDNLIFIPSRIEPKYVRKEKHEEDNFRYEKYFLLNGGGNLTIVRKANGKLKKIISINNALYPFEIRIIELDFKNPAYPDKTIVSLQIDTLGGWVKKEVVLIFDKGAAEPCFGTNPIIHLWGAIDIKELNQFFNEVYNQALKSHYLDINKKDLGVFGQVLDIIIPFSESKRGSKKVLLLLNQAIEGIPIHLLQVDYYWINGLDTFLVEREPGGRLQSLLRYRRVSFNEIRIDELNFQNNGSSISFTIYDTLKQKITTRQNIFLPLMKTEP